MVVQSLECRVTRDEYGILVEEACGIECEPNLSLGIQQHQPFTDVV